MDSSVSPKDEIWFLRVCHHISAGLYHSVPHYITNGTTSVRTPNVRYKFVRTTGQDSNTNIHRSSCKYPLLLPDFNENWMFLPKHLKYQISRQSANWESSCSVPTDGRSDKHREANSRFSQFSECAKKNQPHNGRCYVLTVTTTRNRKLSISFSIQQVIHKLMNGL